MTTELPADAVEVTNRGTAYIIVADGPKAGVYLKPAEPVASPLKWHGGKSYLASKIVALMPPHVHYVEPFAGGLSVLLARDGEGYSEVVNDLNRELTNFWLCIQCGATYSGLQRWLEATPFSEAVYQAANGKTAPDGEKMDAVAAFHFFVKCRQSLAGRMNDFATLSRTRTRRGMNEQASAWLSAVDGLPTVHDRLKRVVILNRPALDVIRTQDGPDTLFYLDPPYLDTTRTSPKVYAHEMTAQQHEELLNALAYIKGRFILSGYPSPLYNAHADLRGWNSRTFNTPNNSAGGPTKRIMPETVWMNYIPPATE